MTVNDLINEVKTGTLNISGIVNAFNVNMENGLLPSGALKNALAQYKINVEDITAHIKGLLMQRGDSVLRQATEELSPRE